ncbi:putative RuvA domain 2, restriction endonuclease type II [Rosa chinensis]|uniref:Putative RuvA domain 2, restriction endonuclease type II n=1 Tax=Rosa chinensis TaxID=74649 RepID=A0A2P6P912_ROSCH|nr:DNA repair endonuclease UVH1 [Rosa chinensis]PRQ18415.1 putative RuvA domain 2, restriction endonuclease type II [Rosa chinensis]
MVQFHEHIIADLLDAPPNGTGLVILSSGLSLPKLISSLLLLHTPSQGTLLILSPHNPSSFKSQLLHHFHPNPIPEITADLPATHRNSLYSSGNPFFITPRILIVDLLTSRIPTSQIAGLVIPAVHSLSETSTEAFIVRIFRSLNKTAFVRAFSDKPHAMVSGFAKTERTMKCLYMRRLHLWPRFHVEVSNELERDAPEVVDIRVPMTKYMVGIQKAIIEVMDACLKEMRKTNKVDVEDLTVENGLFKSFDEIVRRQLDPIWHTLGKKTKQLVSDLKTLRKLLDYLVRYDAVTYLKYLDTLRVSESFRSVWIFAESSYKIFEYAKKRVYRFVTSSGVDLSEQSKSLKGKKRKLKGDDDKEQDVGGTSTTSVVLDEVLEEAPKWKVLREVLEEIEEERQKHASSREELLVEDDVEDSDIVLVACKDERSCMQLEDLINKGPQKIMREEWENYLLGKGQLRDLHTRYKKKPKKAKGFGILDGVVQTTAPQNTEASSINKQEHDALLAAASAIRNRAKKEDASGDDPQPIVSGRGRGKGKGKVVPVKSPQNAEASSVNKQEPASGSEVGNQTKKDNAVGDDPQLLVGKGRGKGKGKVRNRKGAASVKTLGNKVGSDDKKEETNDTLVISDSENEGQADEIHQAVTADSIEAAFQGDPVGEGVLRKHTGQPHSTESRTAKPLPPVHFYALESGQPILDILRPSTIVVYHPDMTFVREIEVHKAENPSKKLKVYFLFYENSSEGQKFEASIRRENGAFESLIRQKSLMMIPVDQDGNCMGLNSSLEPEVSSQNSITRKAGGRREVEKQMQVIVDMREFMSSLPNVLHQKGMRIIPVTLEVGDYILSPLICVERKSIQDLFMSFTSGRLYNQVETMVRYYRIPVLLIEFSQDKSFSFQSASDIGDDVTPNSIISKLSLLVLHFPRLRIIWSRSLYATAEIFATLKANQDEPDETKATRVGVPSEDGIIEDDVRAENYNTSAVEFLRRLPGVTDSNYRAIMDGCKSLAELALMPVERLAELMGGHKAARTLREFLDAKYPTLL